MGKWILLAAALGLLALALWRGADHLADRRMSARLLRSASHPPARFDPAQITTLPEPAQRYLRFAIAEGAVLAPAVRLKMEGTFRLDDRALKMHAWQVLTPEGFVWAMRARDGALLVSGSDSLHWTRFWAEALIPVARVSGTPDHTRSAHGRLAIERALWAPASVLPGPDIRWKDAGPDIARVVIGTNQVDLHLLPSGQPVSVVVQRWSNENPDEEFRLQPFGGELDGFAQFEGLTIPTRVRVGNHFGTPDYAPFFETQLTEVEVIAPQ